MKTFYFTIKHANWRNGTTVAITAGFIIAENEEKAEEIIFKNVSTTNTFGLHLMEVKENETFYADYLPAAIFR